MNIKAVLETAIEQYKSGKLDDSAASLSALIEKYPENPDANNLYGVVLGAKGNFVEAENKIKKAIESGKITHSFYFNLAQIYKQQYRIDEAIDCCKKAIEKKPDYFQALREIVIYLNYKGRNEEALKYAEQLTNYHPQKSESFNILGEVYNRSGNNKKAEEAFIRAIDLDPKHYHAYSNLGNLKHNMNQLAEARSLFEKSLELKPNQPIIKHTLAALKGKTTEKPGEEFVVSLFNFYADNFDEHMKALGYRVPELMYESAIRILGKEGKKISIADLGCGTGKLGQLFKPHAEKIIGVDLAPKMLEKSASLKVYDELVLGDVVKFLEQREEIFDVILSADTFIYVGALEQLFAAAEKRLEKSGIMVFSIEEDTKGEKYSLHESGRYKHSRKYILDLAERNNFKLVHDEVAGIRMQFDKMIPGRIMILEKK